VELLGDGGGRGGVAAGEVEDSREGAYAYDEVDP